MQSGSLSHQLHDNEIERGVFENVHDRDDVFVPSRGMDSFQRPRFFM